MVKHTDSLGRVASEDFGSPRQAKKELRKEIREVREELKKLDVESEAAQRSFKKLRELQKRFEIADKRARQESKQRQEGQRSALVKTARLLNTHSPHGRLRQILKGRIGVQDISAITKGVGRGGLSIGAIGGRLVQRGGVGAVLGRGLQTTGAGIARAGLGLAAGATGPAAAAAFLAGAVIQEAARHFTEQYQKEEEAGLARFRTGRAIQIAMNREIGGSTRQRIQAGRSELFELKRRQILTQQHGQGALRRYLFAGRMDEFATKEAKIKLQIHDIKLSGRLISAERIKVEKERIKRGHFNSLSEFSRFNFGKMTFRNWLAFNTYQRETGERQRIIAEAQAEDLLTVLQQRDQQRTDRDNRRQNNTATIVATKQRELALATQNEFRDFQIQTQWNPN